jgi:hypothetical protein
MPILKDLKSIPGTLFVVGAAVALVAIDKTRSFTIDTIRDYRLCRSIVRYAMAIGKSPEEQREALQRDHHG